MAVLLDYSCLTLAAAEVFFLCDMVDVQGSRFFATASLPCFPGGLCIVALCSFGDHSGLPLFFLEGNECGSFRENLIIHCFSCSRRFSAVAVSIRRTSVTSLKMFRADFSIGREYCSKISFLLASCHLIFKRLSGLFSERLRDLGGTPAAEMHRVVSTRR